ncbi:MAG: trypsin-like peptidase domain-containing protein [Bacteroidales bacterium]|nr:trypsin-like peptidase domain-containing protein [Bacteroidales bacterium]
MKKEKYILFNILLWIGIQISFGQISQGGEPLPPTMFRHASEALFVEMESFDAKPMLKEDSIAALHHRAARFAKKFYTDLSPQSSGIRFTTADGTHVWQCGIRSKGAYSINLLFSEYHVPSGAKLFVYNINRTHKIGAFTEINNNKYDKLPTAPIYGDEIIVEYQEPANAEFKGKITIGEVNHDYSGLTFRGRPGSLSSSQTCHRDAACYPQYEDQTQAVTLLIINGNEYCTGCLVNNVEQDGTPYLLSAAHCFLPSGTTTSETRAQNTVVFFNYQNPSCQIAVVGSEEMSLASADLVVNEPLIDVALLKLSQKPPTYFRPYYAGWNVGTPATIPYFGIHHPMSKTKKIATSEKKLTLESYPGNDMGYAIDPNNHWKIDTWLDGTTEGGSSGSPLFDSNKRVIGILTGGASFCSTPTDDYYFALQKIWSYYPEANRQLKHWLDPLSKGANKLDGYDPYPDSACIRMSNVANNEDVEVTHFTDENSGPVFGHNSLKTKEFGERFITAKETTIYGFNIVLPQWKSNWNGKVNFKIYNGYTTPGQLLTSTTFNLSYLSYSLGALKQITRPNGDASDVFVKLPTPIKVDYSFFISYQIEYPSIDTFAVYNVKSRLSPFNSTYINDVPNGWRALSDYNPKPMKTSLWIDPIIQLGATAVSPIDTLPPAKIIFDSRSRTLYFIGLTPLTNYKLSVYDTTGRLIINRQLESNNSLLLNRIPNGIFLMNIQGDEQILRQKVIIY